MEKLLSIRDLKTFLHLREGVLKAVNGVNLEIPTGRTIGLVGESGSGKSMIAKSILRLLPANAQSTGEIYLFPDRQNGKNIVEMDPKGKAIRQLRGNRISMIFQEPMTAFSPVITIGWQIMESIILHRKTSKKEARDITLDLLNQVGISNPHQRIDEYPHQLSGGMRQRAMIAMALSCQPDLLIADEPTTALDVTVQAQILDLLQNLQEQYGMSILYITHDMSVIAEIADEVAVLYLGEIVEQATVEDIFFNSKHPYTTALLQSLPRISNQPKQPLKAIEGMVPLPINLPKICGFANRCTQIIHGQCDAIHPSLETISHDHTVRCFLYPEVVAAIEDANS